MASIRPETEIDRTQAALAGQGLAIPLTHGDVEIIVSRDIGGTPVGQRLLTVLVNELARMKGVVRRLHVVGLGEHPVLDGTPLRDADVASGLGRLVSELNDDASVYRAEIVFTPSSRPVARVHIGPETQGVLTLAADGWRALLGRFVRQADWTACTPYGAALAATLGAAEIFKQLVAANSLADSDRRSLHHLAYSAFNLGTNDDAQPGPELTSLALRGLAVAGCGAGGTAALYTLAMQPGLTGDIALIEPGRHKLSNLNRYLLTTACDVHRGRHKLASVADHLATFAPSLHPILYPTRWELLDSHPWSLILSTVDTVEARWAIQARSRPAATILDAAVLDMLYTVLRVEPGGWCLECKHPDDPDLPLKQRAARWGQTLETIREWSDENITITTAMIEQLADTQNRPAGDFMALSGLRFREAPALTECGETALRTDVPSQAPVLPIATTPAGVLLAAEIAKHFTTPTAALHNWIGHDLGRTPGSPRLKWRPAVATCPRAH